MQVAANAAQAGAPALEGGISRALASFVRFSALGQSTDIDQ
jgi:hypothetical protein